jgi:predicted esterase
VDLGHGDSDCLVPAGQSGQLNEALESAGADSTFVVLEGAGHADRAFDTEQLQPTIDFLKGESA